MKKNLFKIHDDILEIIKLYNKFRSLIFIRMLNPKRYINTAIALFKINRKYKNSSRKLTDIRSDKYREICQFLYTSDELSNPIMESIYSIHPVHELSIYISKCYPNAPYDQLLDIHSIKSDQIFDGNIFQAPVVVFTVLTVLMQVLPDTVITSFGFNNAEFREVMFWGFIALVSYISIFPIIWLIDFRKERKALKLGKYVLLYMLANQKIANKMLNQIDAKDAPPD